MGNEREAPEARGVTVQVLGSVDLGPEIEGMAGRSLRMRMVTTEPGGVFGPIHDHKDRPGIVYVLQARSRTTGTGSPRTTARDWALPEDRNTTHWLENGATVPTVEISVDIVQT